MLIRSERRPRPCGRGGAATALARGLNILTSQALTLDLPERAKVRSAADAAAARRPAGLVTITLNGEPYHLDGPVSVSTLLARLAIDSRRVAVEHNLVVVRRALFDTTMIREGDEVEIVNFVGGGASAR